MKMQDKEFDGLFRSKLDELEVEPSANLWGDIDAELSSGKRKKLLVILSMAATLIILCTAALIFMQKDVVKPVKHNNIAKNDNAPVINKIKIAKPEITVVNK